MLIKCEIVLRHRRHDVHAETARFVETDAQDMARLSFGGKNRRQSLGTLFRYDDALRTIRSTGEQDVQIGQKICQIRLIHAMHTRSLLERFGATHPASATVKSVLGKECLCLRQEVQDIGDPQVLADQIRR